MAKMRSQVLTFENRRDQNRPRVMPKFEIYALRGSSPRRKRR